MEPVAGDLIEAFVAAYRPYVEERLKAAGLPPLDASLGAGETWLRATLELLLSLPFSEQTRSPLEIFQEAMRFPTEELAGLAAAEPARDPGAVTALPGDRYDLAPASSQALGEDAWRAHLAWGAAKAAAHSRPSAILVSRNLIDASKVRAAADRAGYVLTVVGRIPEGRGRHAVAFVDLEHPDADEAIRILVETSGMVIAFGPHVDDFALGRAMMLGAREAVARSRFFSDPAAWLPAVV